MPAKKVSSHKVKGERKSEGESSKDSFALYLHPNRQVIDGSVFWYWRRGGYNPADGSYGRCTTKQEAARILEASQLSALRKDLPDSAPLWAVLFQVRDRENSVHPVRWGAKTGAPIELDHLVILACAYLKKNKKWLRRIDHIFIPEP